ncbi:uncharacterized protein M421DRAFT_374502 [Didymella exigua CBS 183.55]|uniref:Uncharacterized protein n=1 Tax=Didymella exigua CBS 183.55 TaxID=1150837 RepID=A0A6A5RTG0_9PLEO|nr:uncharacterized protein M421DRAFT_374502 [Didymella exigua CBS 183.55]KAF1930444.1 hypothetical protein M421DRAFT_374502 [Didymella exigua CBS 183.55]
MGRRDDSPPRRPEPSYRFDSYEDGKPKWAPQTPTEDPRGNRDYQDNRRDSRRHKERYEDDAPPPPPPQESRPRPRRTRSYSSGSDSEVPPAKPPRRSNTTKDRNRRPRDHYDSYDEHPRRDDRRHDNRGYVSDDRHNRPRKDYDDHDRRDRRRDDRDRSRDRSRDRHDDRDRDYDRRDRDVGRSGQPEWQKQAMGMFTAYALPIIKKEGTKYLANKMGGGGRKR